MYFGDRSLRNVCAGRASTTAFTETFAQAALGPTAFTETFAQVAQVPRHLPGRLRRLRKSRGIYRDVCASRASPAAFALAFAGVPASLAAFALAFAGVPASLTAFALAFAGVPASLTAFALAFAGVPASLTAFALAFAGVSASPAAFALAFAGIPQVPRHLLWRLRESRKSRGICFGVCGSSRKSHGICFGVCGSSRKRFQEVGSARNNVATHAHCLTVSLLLPKKQLPMRIEPHREHVR